MRTLRSRAQPPIMLTSWLLFVLENPLAITFGSIVCMFMMTSLWSWVQAALIFAEAMNSSSSWSRSYGVRRRRFDLAVSRGRATCADPISAAAGLVESNMTWTATSSALAASKFWMSNSFPSIFVLLSLALRLPGGGLFIRPPGSVSLRRRPGQLCSHSRFRERTMRLFVSAINVREVIWE